MVNKIKSYLLMAIMALTPMLPILVPATAHGLATCNDIAGNISTGAQEATGGTDTDCNDADSALGSNGIGGLAANIVNIFSIVVGAVSVLMIIYGGFRYITSGGDSGRVGNAKNTLVYAIIGLVIVALAQVIVHFVLGEANNLTSG
jgi:hypothetical protein